MSEPNGNARRADSTEAKRERSYLEGRRRAYIDMLMRALEALGYMAHKAKVGLLVAEMEEGKQRLRGLCERHGDNDWRNDEHLADIIEKHLGDYLDAPGSIERGDDAAPDVDAAVVEALGAPMAPFVSLLPTNNADVSSCDGCPFAYPPLTLDDRYCSLDTAITWRPSQTEARTPPSACPLRREHVLVRLHGRVA
jgi:hypothetical protein